MKKVLEKRNDIVFYIKLYPIVKVDPNKFQEIACEKHVKMLNSEKTNADKKECDIKEIDGNVTLAKSLGITGTPALIMPDGKIYSGKMPADKLIKLIDRRR